ncbi:hypothetical protein D3C87_2128550 [compost metagenome]
MSTTIIIRPLIILVPLDFLLIIPLNPLCNCFKKTKDIIINIKSITPLLVPVEIQRIDSTIIVIITSILLVKFSLL